VLLLFLLLSIVVDLRAVKVVAVVVLVVDVVSCLLL